jgi:hypothetical protein
MKKLSYIFIFLLLTGALAFSSCRDELSDTGSKWLTSSFNNFQTDTCTVLLSTVLSDSLATSGDTICQIGHYYDTTRGNINVSHFTEYNVTGRSLADDKRYSFDSITVRLYSSGDYVGDTLAGPQKIAVYKLTQNVDLDDDGYLFNCSNLKYESTPLTTFSYTPHPGLKKKAIEVRLPDSFGQDWYDRMINGEDRLQQQIYFRDYFKGLVFKPVDTDSSINGFQANDSSFVIAMYYHDITNTPTGKKAVFTPSSTKSFNKVNFDRTGTPIAKIQTGINNALSSNETGHVAYLQGLTGLYTMIDFPYLNNIMAEGQMVSIEKAYLQLYPVKYSYDADHPLPTSVTLYTTDVSGVTGDVIYNLAGSSVQTGSLVTDLSTYTDTYYTFDITSFLQEILGTSGTSKKRLKLILPDKGFFSTCQGLLLGDMKHPTSNVKLTLLYKTYNEQK